MPRWVVSAVPVCRYTALTRTRTLALTRILTLSFYFSFL